MKTSTFKLINFLFLSCISILLLKACKDHQAGSAGTLQGDPDNGGIQLPDGFTAVVVAESLGRGRHIAVNTNGDIYLSLERRNKGGGIVALRDTTSDGRADIIRYFGDYTGTGIGIHKGYLYFGTDTAVIRYKLRGGELLPDPVPEIIAWGFIDNRQHASKPFAFDGSGNMFVNVGAPSNACQNPDRTPGTPGTDPCPLLEYAGGIWKFSDDAVNQHQLRDGKRYASGLRNCVAIEWNNADGHLYVVQHGRDQLSQFFPGIYSEDEGVNLPSEAFYRLEEGDDCGWPYCYYDQLKNKTVLAPEYGGNGEITGRCSGKKDPLIGFPGHIAPNDLIFYTGKMFPVRYRDGAFIAFHGSWNRAPREQKGFNVIFAGFKDNEPTGEWTVFADGFAGSGPVMSPGDARYRPCGLAQGPDGSLYISDSRQGKIWRVIYR